MSGRRKLYGLRVWSCMVLLSGVAAGDEFTATPLVTRGGILVEVLLNGQGPYPFLLDAAAQRPVLDIQVAQYLKLANVGAAAKDAALASLDSFQYAGLPAHTETVAVMALGGLASRLGQRVAGVLPAWRPGLELTLDLKAPRVHWRALGEGTLETLANGAIPMRVSESGAPKVTLEVNGRELEASLDLAYPAALGLPAEMAADLVRADSPTMRVSTSKGGTTLLRRVAQVRVGNVVLKGAACEVGTEAPLVGLDFLRLAPLTINFEYGLVRVGDEEQSYQSEPVSGCGVVLHRMAETLWEVGVVAGSAAEAAGVAPGDLLLKVSGVDAPSYTHVELQQMLGGAPETCLDLMLVRGGETYAVSLTSTKLL